MNTTIDYGKKSVLVIDDFHQHLYSMKKILESIGFVNIALVQKAKEAINLCNQYHYDIILSDFNLGEGKNGHQILEEIRYRKTLKHTSLFIMITAETNRYIVMGTLEHEPDGYIVKPFNELTLRRKIDRLLARQDAVFPVNQAIDAKNYLVASQLCNKVIGDYPKYESWCLKVKASLFCQLGDYESAIKVYKAELEKRFIDWAKLGLAQAYMSLKSYDKAMLELEMLIKNNPSCVAAYDMLAECYKYIGEVSKAYAKLEKAVSISPVSSQRQARLGDISTVVGDLDCATSAFRSAVKFSKYSVHDSSNNCFKLVRSLTDTLQGDLSSDDYQKCKEVKKVIQEIDKQYAEEKNIDLQKKLVEARILFHQQKEKEAKQCILEIEALAEEPESALGPEVKLDLANTYLLLGEDEKCNDILKELSHDSDSDIDLKLKIQAIDSNVQVQVQKRQVNELNEKAVEIYGKGKLQEAIRIFLEAVKITPKSVAVNLNLIQALVKYMEANKTNTEYMMICKHCIDNVANITRKNEQYKRYKELCKLYGKLEKTTSNG